MHATTPCTLAHTNTHARTLGRKTVGQEGHHRPSSFSVTSSNERVLVLAYIEAASSHLCTSVCVIHRASHLPPKYTCSFSETLVRGEMTYLGGACARRCMCWLDVLGSVMCMCWLDVLPSSQTMPCLALISNNPMRAPIAGPRCTKYTKALNINIYTAAAMRLVPEPCCLSANCQKPPQPAKPITAARAPSLRACHDQLKTRATSYPKP